MCYRYKYKLIEISSTKLDMFYDSNPQPERKHSASNWSILNVQAACWCCWLWRGNRLWFCGETPSCQTLLTCARHQHIVARSCQHLPDLALLNVCPAMKLCQRNALQRNRCEQTMHLISESVKLFGSCHLRGVREKTFLAEWITLSFCANLILIYISFLFVFVFVYLVVTTPEATHLSFCSCDPTWVARGFLITHHFL